MKILLDPGHGGKDPGAVACGVQEKELVLKIAHRAAETLTSLGFDVGLTRSEDSELSIAKRTSIARQTSAGLFISIHANAACSSARGLEAFVVSEDLQGSVIAARVLDFVSCRTGQGVRGVKWDNESQHTRLGVLRGTYRKMPAVLIECGFLTNTLDRSIMTRPDFGATLGMAIAKALE